MNCMLSLWMGNFSSEDRIDQCNILKTCVLIIPKGLNNTYVDCTKETKYNIGLWHQK